MKLRAGDVARVDAASGRLEALVDEADWARRTVSAEPDLSRYASGIGRELFANFRAQVGSAETGAAAVTFLTQARSIAEADLDAVI